MSTFFLQQLSEIRLVPVIKLSQVRDAIPLAQSLVAGRLPIAEVTLRTDCALDCIREMAGVDSIHVGAGTVLNREQCELAIDAGATFIVSPGLDDGVVEMCRSRNLPCFPGIATATELQRAYNLGLRTVKFFPAAAAGGIPTITALAAPFPEMQFVPTGGVNLENLRDYLKVPQVAAVGGSWMVKPHLFDDGDFGRVTDAAISAVAAAKQLSD